MGCDVWVVACPRRSSGSLGAESPGPSSPSSSSTADSGAMDAMLNRCTASHGAIAVLGSRVRREAPVANSTALHSHGFLAWSVTVPSEG
jgi:hypothetical protein